MKGIRNRIIAGILGWALLFSATPQMAFGAQDTLTAAQEDSIAPLYREIAAQSDQLVGYDPYTDVDGNEYALPPTYWALCGGNATAKPLEFIEKLTAHGNDVPTVTCTGTDHTGVYTLNTEEMFSDTPELPEEHQNPQALAGKTISILGDSISTYTGISDNGAYNSTIAGGAVYYTEGRQGVYQADTWWQQAIDALGMELLVNNSWSGSCILHTRSGTAGAYLNRCTQLHNDRADEDPDIIAVFMGTNDFSYYQSALGTADIEYDTLISDNGDGTYTYAEPATTCEAYAVMLHKMTTRYPNAEIYCMTLLARRAPDYEDSYADVGQPSEFNSELAKVIEHFGCAVVDLESCGIDKDAAVFDQYIGDKRVHPNAEGMDLITNALVSAMLGKDTKVYSINQNLSGVTADNDICVTLAGSSYTLSLTAAQGYTGMEVTVTMDGLDVTESVYADGLITIGAVTGDVVIEANAVPDKAPENYRWEFDGSSLVSSAAGSNLENALSLQAGSITDGVLSGVRYALTKPVVLAHDREWVVEWRCGGDWSGMLLTSVAQSATQGMNFLFRTYNATGLLAFGEYSGQYNNYGIALANIGLDMAAAHTYRLENRIADNGGNMVWLSIDGVEIGAMNNYYIAGTNDQNKTVDWVSGKNFVFSHIGSTSHPLKNMELDYLQVWEDGEKPEPLALRYDDHFDVSSKTVEIVDAGTPTSYQVGYGVEENTVFDAAVVTLDGDALIATGIGTAKVRMDGTLYEITVTAAPISLILLAGQSNMQGSEGNADQSIVCPDGMVYASYGDRYTMTVDNAANFAPSALTGSGSTLNVNGNSTNLEDWPVYLLNEAGAGKAGPDSGFAHEWVKQTGEKVWIVNAAHGGSSITTWQDGGANYEEALLLFSACQETLRKEIAAGHYTLSHTGYFWCQGCTDYSKTAQWYVEKYLAMHENFKTELSFDHDSDPATEDRVFEFGGIIPVRAGHEHYTSYRQGVYADSTTAKYHESFKDLRFTGPRVAQYWMGNNPELEDIWLVCNIGEDWVTMPDGSDGVAEYFAEHYENGTVDYRTQVQQSESWYSPTTPAAVHDSIHYNQIGYNEVGRQSVRTALIMLGEIPSPEVEISVEFLTWDGYTAADELSASATGSSGTLVVPVVYPLWKSKDIGYALSDGLSYEYYDLLADSPETTGTLSAVGAEGSVAVVKAEPGAHFARHLSQLPEEMCCGVNLWSVLEHDKYYYASGTQWGIHSSGTVYSVTIPVSEGDMIFASSFGKSGENGHASSNGIRVSFFDEYGVAKTLSPGETYAEFSANGGYLVVPEGAIAVNIPMWTVSDEWEIYILNREHCYSGTTCSICGETHPEAADYAGKVISILGDSISTFAGYIPVADGFNLEHLPRYPQDNLLTDVNETWWMQVISALDAKLGINDSWRGATVCGAASVTSGVSGEKSSMSNLQRIQNLGSKGTPDVILFYGGTNDIAHVSKVGTFDPEKAPTEADLSTAKWDNLADGYVHTLLRLRYYYPEAKIIAMLPTYTASYYSNDKLAEANATIADICEHYGVVYVDLRYCGITTSDLPDGIHPNATGMDYITDAVLDALLEKCDITAGENVVYSVTHELSGVTASLGYYSGISAGRPFAESLTADNEITVTVTMGGEDVTASCYADGKISIASVTGELVVTAEAKFSLGDRLQQLPEKICAGVNLWPLLEHDADYYTVSGWGVHSSGNVYSVTIPINPGDRIWATSFGKAGANGSSINGIRLTWFGENGLIKSLSSNETYSEFSANGYLTAPEGARAVNVVMWTGSDSNELYILSAEHSYESTVTAPTCTEGGYTTHSCGICGHSYVDSETEAAGHSYTAGMCTVCGQDTVSVTLENGTLSISSPELEEGSLLYLAAYDGSGRFLSMERIVWSGLWSAPVPEGAKFKLMFMDGSWTPLRLAIDIQ